MTIQQQFQAPLSHILEVVLGYDTNHVINKILLENAMTTLTGFMLLDEELIKLLDTTYNEEKHYFHASQQQNLLVAVEWVNSIIRENPQIHENEWKKFRQLDYQAFVSE